MIKKHSIIWFYVFTLIFTIILGGAGQALCVNFVAEQHGFTIFYNSGSYCCKYICNYVFIRQSLYSQ